MHTSSKRYNITHFRHKYNSYLTIDQFAIDADKQTNKIELISFKF